MDRTVIKLSSPNTIDILGENIKSLGDLICYSLVNVGISAEFERLMEKISPKGPGFYIPEVIGVYWVDDKEASVFNYDGFPEIPVPDYPNLDIWNVGQETAFGGDKFEIEGSELWRLFLEAYKIYVQRGLIDGSNH